MPGTIACQTLDFFIRFRCPFVKGLPAKDANSPLGKGLPQGSSQGCHPLPKASKDYAFQASNTGHVVGSVQLLGIAQIRRWLSSAWKAGCPMTKSSGCPCFEIHSHLHVQRLALSWLQLEQHHFWQVVQPALDLSHAEPDARRPGSAVCKIASQRHRHSCH